MENTVASGTAHPDQDALLADLRDFLRTRCAGWTQTQRMEVLTWMMFAGLVEQAPTVNDAVKEWNAFVAFARRPANRREVEKAWMFFRREN